MAVLKALIALMKPRQTLLMMLTMVGSYVVAGGSLASQVFILLLLIGLSSIGGATALNMYMEEDIDKAMKRTSKRPLPSRLITKRLALLFSVSLMALGVILASMIGEAVALSVMGGYYFYILSYTSLTKRYYPLASLILGSIAGSMPALGGWAAARGYISVEGVLLASLVFLWQPAHVALLNYYYREDYLSAGVRVLTEKNPEKSLRMALVVSPLLVALAMWVFVYLEKIGFLGALILSLLSLKIVREAERIKAKPAKVQLVALFKNVGILIAVPYTLVPIESLLVEPFYLTLASLLE